MSNEYTITGLLATIACLLEGGGGEGACCTKEPIEAAVTSLYFDVAAIDPPVVAAIPAGTSGYAVQVYVGSAEVNLATLPQGASVNTFTQSFGDQPVTYPLIPYTINPGTQARIDYVIVP